ncbi:MAG: dihydrodipicolinate synthase family protein, partial [Pseudonocardia sp.]
MPSLVDRLRAGVVIPAHPLALTEAGDVDLVAQRALSRYYVDAGAHGLAVGVHTTQFALHDDRGLLAEVWRLAADTARATLLVAGVCGDVPDA